MPYPTTKAFEAAGPKTALYAAAPILRRGLRACHGALTTAGRATPQYPRRLKQPARSFIGRKQSARTPEARAAVLQVLAFFTEGYQNIRTSWEDAIKRGLNALSGGGIRY